MLTTRLTRQHTQSQLATLHRKDRRGESGGLWGRGEEIAHPAPLALRHGPRQRFTRLLDAHGAPRSLSQVPPRAEPSRAVLRAPLARALAPARPRPGAAPAARRHRRPSPGRCQSRPAHSRLPAAGPAPEPAPRARPSLRQHPGKRRRRRRLLGPQPLGPRPGPAGSSPSGRAGPPPTDSQLDRPTGRKEGRKNRPTTTLPPQRPRVTVRSPNSAILLARPPSSSSLEETLPNCRPPPAPPPLAPPRPARPSTHSRSYRPAPPL